MPRGSLQVGLKGAQTLYYAERQAERIGLPLNMSITINLSLLGIHPAQATNEFKKLRSQRFAPWARRPSRKYATWSFTPAYSYGFENSRDGKAFNDPDGEHNVHVHWTTHVPSARRHDFENRLHDWVDEIAGNHDWPAHAVQVKVITKPGRVAVYPVKGASRLVAKRYGMKKEDIAAQGFITGRRTGTTINIGPAARRALDKELGISRKRS